MRYGLLLLLIAFSGSIAGNALAQPQKHAWCRAKSAPRLEIKTSTDRVIWNFSKSEKDLNHFNIDTVNPYGKEVITDVGGLMQGGIMLKEQMRFNTLTYTTAQQICYWYDQIEITLHIQPTIYIAREFPQGSCKHNAIREHELKHISVDREIVNKYAALIGQALKKEVDRQPVFGPYLVSQSPQVEAYLKSRLDTLLRAYSTQMDQERRQRQQKVDSLEEYERVNTLCREKE